MSLSVAFDDQLVMYTQKTFRQILDSMARPGKVNVIEPFPMAEDTSGDNDSPYLLGLGYTLLDVEVGFYVFKQAQFMKKLAADFEFYTSAKVSPLGEADFIFMTAADKPQLLADVKCGNLNYPDTGVTVIIKTNYLSEVSLPETGRGLELQLKGPGILGQKALFVAGITERHVQVLRDINAEFPLGIDLILVWDNRVACIPRSVAVDIRRN
jgi:alpha-D-ribose 1-methylphosphonate 5-triphosphate synthase subunit PhnH